jgi:hypothetical protein
MCKKRAGLIFFPEPMKPRPDTAVSQHACPHPVRDKNGELIHCYCCSVECAIESGIISKEFAIREGLNW